MCHRDEADWAQTALCNLAFLTFKCEEQEKAARKEGPQISYQPVLCGCWNDLKAARLKKNKKKQKNASGA